MSLKIKIGGELGHIARRCPKEPQGRSRGRRFDDRRDGGRYERDGGDRRPQRYSIHLSIILFIHLFIHYFIYLFIYLFISEIYLFIY